MLFEGWRTKRRLKSVLRTLTAKQSDDSEQASSNSQYCRSRIHFQELRRLSTTAIPESNLCQNSRVLRRVCSLSVWADEDWMKKYAMKEEDDAEADGKNSVENGNSSKDAKAKNPTVCVPCSVWGRRACSYVQFLCSEAKRNVLLQQKLLH